MPSAKSPKFSKWKFENLKATYKSLLNTMFEATHPASLAVARILFGFLMFLDIPAERAGSYADVRWGDPSTCYFPLFPQLQRFTLPWMCLLYGAMWVGALGISLGYKFKFSCAAFALPYWYLLLLDKSFWNNHSYLYGLLSILFFVSSASNYWSVDSFLKKDGGAHVPSWNYFIIKFQFFILYFYSGLKKTDMEWLEGYSMKNLGRHWVFRPFNIFLTYDDIDILVIHWTGFLLDLTVGFFLINKRTRPAAMIFCAMFHIMNTRLFSIGMFPYVCLATMPIFCEHDWPIKLLSKIKLKFAEIQVEQKTTKIRFNRKHHQTIFLLCLYCFLQTFLPYSHFITKGYNNWTNGLYGYSWDMMVHSWDTTLVVVKLVENNSGKEHFLDPEAWTHNDRWSKHADMTMQYAQCLKENLLMKAQKTRYITSENISIYIDVWCSLNGRFQQRMFNPNYDLLKARWSPFKPVEWLLPLLTEYSGLREKMTEIQEHVYSWSNYTDVLFVADFPGLYLENYIEQELINITLTVIEGEVYYESEDLNVGYKLMKGQSFPIMSDVFHKVYTISDVPSCFMYTFTNKSRLHEQPKEGVKPVGRFSYSRVPLLEDRDDQIDNIIKMFQLIYNSILNILFDVPMATRTVKIDNY